MMKDVKIDDNSNSLKENDEEEKEAINIEFTQQIADSENDKILLTYVRWIYKEKTRKIAMANLIKSLLNQTDVNFFYKKSNCRLFDYYDIIPKEKKKLRWFILK